ncbi:hypothetical protein AAFC00_003071 [Neodothiora populina]
MSGNAMIAAMFEPGVHHISHDEMIPGTEVMRDDIQGTSHAVLVPTPSSSKDDPLNWSVTWKTIVAVTQLIYVWVGVSSALSLAPVFPFLGAEFHLNTQQLSLLTGLNVVTLGVANIFIVPISNIFGRRLTSILFGVLLVLTCVWEALATTHKSLLAARACNGIAAATSESIMVQVIADMCFLNERGTLMGVYFTTYFMGAFLGPIMSGNIAARHGWRSFFWLSTALSVLALVLVIISQPETKYHRLHRTEGHMPPEIQTTSQAEKVASSNDVTEMSKSPPPERSNSVTTAIFVGKGRPSRRQFATYQRPDKAWKKFIVRDVTTPLLIFFNPIIFWAGLMLAGPANLLLIYNLTESSILGASPYNFSAGAVGYTNFGCAVGGLVGVATAGPFSDWIAKRATTRNSGIREAEMRLPALLPYAALSLITSVAGGFALQNHWPWPAIVILCYFLSGLSVSSLPTIALSYAIDCFKPISGEIMVVATLLKNILGFCLSYWVFDVAAAKGWTVVFGIQTAVVYGPVILSLPLWIYGKKIRRWYRQSGLHRMEEMI